MRAASSPAMWDCGLPRAPVVAFCDSDDLWQPEFLEQMAALWRCEPEVKVAYSNFRIVRANVWSDDTKFDAAPCRVLGWTAPGG